MAAEEVGLKLIYIAGPYSAPTESGVFDNIMRARERGLALIKAGYAVIIPHLNSAFMPVTRDEIMPGDLEILSRCDAIYLLRGWRTSKGAQQEWKRAIASKLEIYEECHREPPDPGWYVMATVEARC